MNFMQNRLSLSLVVVVWLLAGCAAPIGADRVSTRQAYEQVDANTLRTGKPGAETVSVLHRFDLDRLATAHPDEAVRQLHQKALATGERDLLFALAELSYAAGNHVSRSVKPWDPRDARDYYLGSAIYAWLYLFGDGKDPKPGAFDRRFREACDFYNYSLGLALTERRSTNSAVRFQNGRRRLPVGELELRFEGTNLTSQLGEFDEFLLADQYRVRGLSARNRSGGMGAPLICVGALNAQYGMRRCAPATLFLRGPGSLNQLAAGNTSCPLELYSGFEQTSVQIGGAQVPLETDLTTYRAYTLNQSFIWQMGMLQFLNPAERIQSQLVLNQPYTPGRIPVVVVHGTFSSPVTWAEMANSLTADPVLRKNYQLWSFVYGSGNPLLISAEELRDALTEMVQKLDPDGSDPALRQMVVIGHSQGGLLTKLTATDTGDRIWNLLFTNRVEDLKVSEPERQKLNHLLVIKPLPFVSRVVFISTPHRGSYLAGGFVRRWAYRLMSLPEKVASRSKKTVQLFTGSSADTFLNGKVPTSLDGMSPKNPVLLTLAEIPVTPSVKAHSIIPVLGDGDYHLGRDGLVTYQSAHIEGAESEFIVRGPHTCLNMPSTIEEVRRIMRQHLDELPAGTLSRQSPVTASSGKESAR